MTSGPKNRDTHDEVDAAHPLNGADGGSPSGPPSASGSESPSGRDSHAVARGADLARAALDAARARNAAARTGSGRGVGGPRGQRPGAGDPAGEGADAGARRLRRRRWSGPGADRARDPQRIGDTVNSWLAATGSGREVTKANLFARWAELVGADIAAHAMPVSLVDGELVVQADSTAWATQLRLLAPGMITKINGTIGRGTVARIRTKGPTGPSWRFGNRHVPGRGPRDTYG